MNLETKYAAILIRMLEDAQDVGLQYAVFELRPMEYGLQPHQVDLFETLGEALDHWEVKAGFGYLPGGDETPVYYRSVDQLLEEIKLANSLIKNNSMNRNNLENLREEMTMLGFEPKIIAEMEQKMEKELPAFQLRTSIPGAKGQADFLLQFKKSGQSENYYLNRFDVTHNKVKPLEEGHKYMVISPGEEPGKNVHRKFDSPYEAIEYFKEQKGTSELASGKDIAHKTTLATMEKDKVNYVSKDFNRTYYAPVVTQSFYPDRGNGFTATQAANLIEGRAVYRDDLVNRGGVPYKAWVKLDMDSPKDNSHNYTTNQYNDPAYGFHLEQVLEKYNIRELANPEQKQALIESLYNGNRPTITAVKDGQEVKMQLEAVPRYSQVNLYQQNGKPEKREQFLKEPIQEQGIKVEKGKAKEQEQDMALNK